MFRKSLNEKKFHRRFDVLRSMRQDRRVVPKSRRCRISWGGPPNLILSERAFASSREPCPNPVVRNDLQKASIPVIMTQSFRLSGLIWSEILISRSLSRSRTPASSVRINRIPRAGTAGNSVEINSRFTFPRERLLEIFPVAPRCDDKDVVRIRPAVASVVATLFHTTDDDLARIYLYLYAKEVSILRMPYQIKSEKTQFFTSFKFFKQNKTPKTVAV